MSDREPAVAPGRRIARLQRAAAVLGWVEAERGRFALWLPVFMGAGVARLFRAARRAAVRGSGSARWRRRGRRDRARLAQRHAACRGRVLALAAAALGFASAQFATVRAPPLAAVPRHATIVCRHRPRGRAAAATGRRVTLEAPRLDGGAPAAAPGAHPPARRGRRRCRSPPATRCACARCCVPPSPPAYPGALGPAARRLLQRPRRLRVTR